MVDLKMSEHADGVQKNPQQLPVMIVHMNTGVETEEVQLSEKKLNNDNEMLTT